MTRIAHSTWSKGAATAGALAALTLTLTACGGSGIDGEYFDSEGYGKLTIEGSSVTYHDFDCEDGKAWIEDEVSASGELNDEGTSVRWASDDEHIAQDSVGGTESMSVESYDSGDVITIGDHEFAPGDEDELLDTYSERCS